MIVVQICAGHTSVLCVRLCLQCAIGGGASRYPLTAAFVCCVVAVASVCEWSFGSCPLPMSSNVIVAVRIRPANSAEQAADTHRPILQRLNATSLRFDPDAFAGRTLPPGSRRAKDLSYRFDHVFGPEATQEEVYRATAGKCIDKVVAGCNATIFGQTHTHEDREENGERVGERAGRSRG